jgi:hypothetical protein
MKAITKDPAFGVGKLLHVKNPRARNSGTTVVTTMKHELDVQLNSEKLHGKFHVPTNNVVEKNPENCYIYMSYSKKSKGT